MTTESEPKTDAKPVPTGVQLTALDETFAANPYPVMAEVREREPVHYDAVIKRWILTRFDDVDAVLRDRTMAVDARKAAPGTYMAMFAERDREPSMLMQDDPTHARLRGLVNKTFTPRAVELLAPRIQEVVDELLDAVAGSESFDLIGAFAGPLPTIVIAEMLGVDANDRADFKRWSDDGVAGFDPFPTDEVRAKVLASNTAMDALLPPSHRGAPGGAARRHDQRAARP